MKQMSAAGGGLGLQGGFILAEELRQLCHVQSPCSV